jgi:aminomethyltransferase
LVEQRAVKLSRRGALLLPVSGGDILVSRTGYTGEDGWEFFGPMEQVALIYRQILSVGDSFGLKPCGLGARDLLRLEMGYPLYGQELTADTTPFDAGLGFAVSSKKGDFFGRKFLLDGQGNPVHHEDHRLLVGFSVQGRGIPRTDCIISSPATGVVTGVVTSGGYSPAAGGGFGLAYMDRPFAEDFSLGAPAHVRIHDQSLPIVFRTRPFVQGGLI